MTFLLPSRLPPGLERDLTRACIAGGPDNMPWPTIAELQPGRLVIRREVDESGSLVLPWEIKGAGRLMSSTATLIEQPQPYNLQVELARGKVHQLRNQANEWQAGGLHIDAELAEAIHQAAVIFSKAVVQDAAEASRQAQMVLDLCSDAAQRLVQAYIDQMFAARHQRHPRLDSKVGCCLGGVTLAKEHADLLRQVCNTICLSFSWGEVQPSESEYNWQAYDTLVKWAEQHGLPLTAGPLINFTQAQMPDWLWLWERDLTKIAKFMCEYVEKTIKRYHRHIRAWTLCNASNYATILGLGEDELLWLTARLIEAARQVDAELELSVGIAQPWGEYMAAEDRTHSPFIFADTLIRSGLNLAGLDIELVMGVLPRGSYCRDLLDTSRLLDLYSLLGVPLRVSLGYPSAQGVDEHADPEVKTSAGECRSNISPAAQADWATAYASLALCKPSIRAVQWVHASDADAHQFPYCGLIGADGKPKPVLHRLRTLREQHLH